LEPDVQALYALNRGLLLLIDTVDFCSQPAAVASVSQLLAEYGVDWLFSRRAPPHTCIVVTFHSYRSHPRMSVHYPLLSAAVDVPH